MTRHHRPPVQFAATTAKRLPWRVTPLLVLLVLALAVLAAGCGASDESTAPQSADAAHQAWIAAIRAGDEDSAVALTDPELPQREQFARDEVNRMQEYLTSPASPTGRLENVTIDPVRDGYGRSVWQFAAKRWCYRAELVSRDEGWFVSRWGQTSVACS